MDGRTVALAGGSTPTASRWQLRGPWVSAAPSPLTWAVIFSGRRVLSWRGLSEALGWQVTWNEAARKVRLDVDAALFVMG